MKPLSERKDLIDKAHSNLSISKQCALLQLNRSSFYYRSNGESELNLELMRLIDEHYLEHPEKGARQMHKWLTRNKGYQVSRNRIERLYYRIMGLRSLQPGPHTSKRCKEHKVFPYLLRDLEANHVNHVWATDITYIPMAKGFLYLTAIIDVHSRYVLHWSISNAMEAEWCAQVFEQATELYGYPEIINTDQGSQYTSDVFTRTVLSKGVKLSMDGKGRATDNAFIERLWRSVKYEKVYLNPPKDGRHLNQMMNQYFDYYNNERSHSSIDDLYPEEKYFQNKKKQHHASAA
jgi:putative transposase